MVWYTAFYRGLIHASSAFMVVEYVSSNIHSAGVSIQLLQQWRRKLLKVRGATWLNSSDFLLQNLKFKRGHGPPTSAAYVLQHNNILTFKLAL